MATKDNEAIALIKKWKSEAVNSRNDGWVKTHYQNKIKEVSKYLDEALKETDINDYEDTIELYKTYGGD